MSALTDLIYSGSNAVAGLTEGAVNDAIAKYGEDKKVSFGDTAYFLPTIYAATGVKVSRLGDLPACVGVLKSLITNKEELGDALNAGLATAVGAEILEALDGTYHIADEDMTEEGDCKGIAAAIQTRVIDEVNRQLDQILINLTLADLVKEYQEFEKYDESMYYI